ncbi:MAG: hypothetical protein LBG49_03535 [Mycoplasmataceae bacterium]|jgi:copper homeostasis protein|nr:hypothetical protein [Mycoplasmataceae bacterium]
MKLIKEACVETKEEIDNAIKHHTDQIELCSRLDLSGLTPSVELAAYAASKCKRVFVMIRRENNFTINFFMMQKLKRDMKSFANIDVAGYVFGFLTKDNKINEKAVRTLVKLANGKETVFHMAFDELVDQKAGIDTLVSLGVTRILTKGGNGKACDNIDTLKQLRKYANNRIQIIAGGSVTDDNCNELAQATGINFFHGRKLAYK